MNRAIILIGATLLLAGCGRSPLELSYNQRLEEARADCKRRGGDEFKPYGIDAWFAVAGLGHPMTFRCLRLDRRWKPAIAVYVFRTEGDRVVVERR